MSAQKTLGMVIAAGILGVATEVRSAQETYLSQQGV
jgi:hypothetical protein